MPEIAEFAEILGRLELPIWELEWQNHAACKGMDTNLWYPERGASRECQLAKSICHDCPVKIQCREYAVSHQEQWGLWGELSLKDRRKWDRMRSTHPRDWEHRVPLDTATCPETEDN
ncbi:WhiB family transcriptional regulator [Mycobacteroides abscessus]|uniref:WhiB family transcriptional regulator n=1 Tax=Mycobacteroides abscessus TaxID=36809 RepID=UPI000C261728|nr:WhiB family transcriptional regulator [Mycobacteroides abscessus]